MRRPLPLLAAAALRATPAGQDNARCAQAVTVAPDSAYTLSAWVQGAYVCLGARTTTPARSWAWTASTTPWAEPTSTRR
ncbi:hypothetical protein BX286_5266 [Streptomyces sp. 3211.6]|nr:hypothetical protein BX286_5266 [Streptomyces sp. 3211.6]